MMKIKLQGILLQIFSYFNSTPVFLIQHLEAMIFPGS